MLTIKLLGYIQQLLHGNEFEWLNKNFDLSYDPAFAYFSHGFFQGKPRLHQLYYMQKKTVKVLKFCTLGIASKFETLF